MTARPPRSRPPPPLPTSTRPGSTRLTVEVPPPRDAVLPADVVLLPRDTALPLLLLLEPLEERCSVVDVRLGSLVRLGRGGSGRLGTDGVETRVSGAEREPVSPPDEL